MIYLCLVSEFAVICIHPSYMRVQYTNDRILKCSLFLTLNDDHDKYIHELVYHFTIINSIFILYYQYTLIKQYIDKTDDV